MGTRFARSVANQLGYYVYIYRDPGNGEVFYVGKGKGSRALAHLASAGPSRKIRRIREIRKSGAEPAIEILVHGLEEEETALKIEAAIIDLLGPEQLTNEARGYKSRSHGRMTVEQIQATYGAEPVEIVHPTLLIRISRHFRHTLSPKELYDVTRSCWKVGHKREQVQLAMPVFAGVVREVYEVRGWFPGNSTFPRPDHRAVRTDRWEFVGCVADRRIRRKYLYKDVSHYLKWGNQNPIAYAGMD